MYLQQKCYYGSNASLTVHSYSCILIICKSLYSGNSSEAIPSTLSVNPACHFKVIGSTDHVGWPSKLMQNVQFHPQVPAVRGINLASKSKNDTKHHSSAQDGKLVEQRWDCTLSYTAVNLE